MTYFSTIVLEIMLRQEPDAKKKKVILQMINQIVNSKESKH